MQHIELARRLRRNLLDTFGPILAAQGPFALVDYPDAANAGDHAIWIGEKMLLKRLGAKVAYECSLETYNKEAMAAALGSGTILMHGGGNFGDTYIYQQFRHRVLADFPDNKIVIFPQTVMFFTDSGIGQSANLFSAHADVTIAVRDVLSLHILQRSFGSHHRIVLAPDMSFMIKPQRRSMQPVFGIVWLSRTDVESVHGAVIPNTVNPQRLRSQNIRLGDYVDGIPTIVDADIAGSNLLLVTDWYRCKLDQDGLNKYKDFDFDQRSQFWLDRALRILSAAHVVITDRLHAHILCTLAGIPHVLLNNSYGKNVSFFETWCRPLDLCQVARSPAEAWALAQQSLLAQATPVRT
jgi:exopolysaccharide biosynthesis predicted pyruvyltransferase EpsI